MNDSPRLTEADELFKRQVSLFESVRSAHSPRIVPLGSVLDGIKSGRWAVAVAKVRNAPSQDEAEGHKRQLAAIKVSGVFNGQDARSLVSHSGLICLDIDGAKDADFSDLRRKLRSDPFVLAFFTSPSGFGLKVIVAAKATDAETHSACFSIAKSHFKPFLPANTELDCHPSNVASNCFVSFDRKIWRATKPRMAFSSDSNRPPRGECGIDIPHVVESIEKELPSPSSPIGHLGSSSGIEDNTHQNPTSAPPPGQILLPGVVDTHIWARFMKAVPHRQGRRNEAIRDRVPILINLVDRRYVELLLLRWYDEAPAGVFKDSRSRHLHEIRCAIEGCLKSWATNAKVGLSKNERLAYQNLRDERQRTTFRIFRSLSLAKPNYPSRTFFITERHLGDRLGCLPEAAARQFDYLEKAGIIALVEKGSSWEAHKRALASRYQWLL